MNTLKKELLFWLDYLPHNNGMPILTPVAAAAVSFSDASGVGIASIITPCPSQEAIVVHRELTKAEQPRSSTYRELVAVYHGLEQAKHLLRNQALRWNTDSQNIVSIIRKGSMEPDLLALAIQIFQITKAYNITLSMTWIPTDDNTAADFHSQVVDYDDWGIDPH